MQGRNRFRAPLQPEALCRDEAQVCEELDGTRSVPSAQRPVKSANHRLLCEASEVRGREGASLALRLQQLAGGVQLLERGSFDLVGGGRGGGQLGGGVRAPQQQAV